MSVKCECGAIYATVDEVIRCKGNFHGWLPPRQSYQSAEIEARQAFEFEYLQAHLREKNPGADYLERNDLGLYFHRHIHEQWLTFKAGYLLAKGWKAKGRVRITGDTSKIPTKAT